MSSDIHERLEEIRDRGLYRRLRCVSGPQGPRVLLDGRPVLMLCSNNYLGLADHPRVREAAAEAAMRYGAGSGASRLVSGNMTIHRRLEESLADFKGAEACCSRSATGHLGRGIGACPGRRCFHALNLPRSWTLPALAAETSSRPLRRRHSSGCCASPRRGR